MLQLKVALIDDHRLFRDGLRALVGQTPDLSIVAEASNAAEAFKAVRLARPDVVVMDVALPGADGIQIARKLLKDEQPPRVLMLSMFLDEERVALALEAGALGYACKEQPADEVLAAIRTVGEGRSYLAPSVSRTLLDEYLRLRRGGATNSPLSVLTAREREIFDLTVHGMSIEGISVHLHISRRTVETHRSRILHKLHAHSAADLVRLAAKLKLLHD